ncbi:adenylyl-sulfate kinase [Campylobacter fetus]|uniref:Adenylyl-sulfate kinase n=1 Tax=Campylobacter fetus TaxID=196 RepID=A0A5L8VB08_CAMFE|nr:adenylyl-sulfate kinase [Campylobacter fetus]HDX6330005.1 adenylyl-sulfate kinase [Campylobacter fetus subsp. venerealis]EAI4415486.1 adenylyl-sulfate kinase [Campylobacter fetus]EAI5408323.1 adenylyl-sulfate kinase [Campylobacter fetus]EAI5647785.1 adenylyl-sulfate kinase [Campylobacter fetus]EAI5945963.1 adenylyl-sulfate kinase [Campylobacter fetus]
MIIWIMGLAGSGKTTLAKELRNRLQNSIYIDGDEFREVFGSVNYDKDSRIKIAMQKARLANALSKQGFTVICTAISMFEQNYNFNRRLDEKYIEIYLKCEFEELVKRDQKGLYTGALSKQIKNVVGVDIKYDEPNADITLDSSDFSNLQANLDKILTLLKRQKSEKLQSN